MELFFRQAGPFNIIVRVKTAVDAVIFTVIGKINGREQGDGIAEVLPCNGFGFLCHFFQEGKGRRREKGHKVVRRKIILLQGRPYVTVRIIFVVKSIAVKEHVIEHV